ncbi:hypothetical protein GCM10007276_28900 [Agaricicola taiwanensis]|uniref:BioF2-like acetyltransferase domain-containing protein n=1 Tax=Agaricicola taiwanensis TaxID=591372 RepID=A0A8J2YKT5_9RHOB|nr:GNAT family N-acetyltransferase [Agaricicola taiwanensis]GGE49981.1 hypothetical protein GCM10007276_28900 [Agaricicola taiwanensis]
MKADEPRWRRLVDAARGTAPFQTFDWLYASAKACEDRGGGIAIVTVTRDGELTVAVPLAIEKEMGVTVARWLGEPLIQYGDAVVSRDAGPSDIEAASSAMRKLPVDVLLLKNVRKGSMVNGVLSSSGAAAISDETARYLDLRTLTASEDFAAWTRNSAAKRAGSAARRLAKLGEISFIAVEGEEARDWARAALALKRQWLTERGIVGTPLHDDRLCEMMIGLSAAPGCMVSVLTLDGKLAAAEIGFFHEGHYAAYLGAFDSALHKYSPGLVQMLYTIEECRRRGVAIYDLLPPDDEYKVRWTSHAAGTATFAEARTALGRAYLQIARLRPAVKKLYHRLPQQVRAGARRSLSRVMPWAVVAAVADAALS